MSDVTLTGRRLGRVDCPRCQRENPLCDDGRAHACVHCRQRFHHRKPRANECTAAYLIAAAVLFIPANTLPVLITTTVISRESDTIAGGIGVLLAGGSWPLAALVFFASMVVPLCKMIVLAWLTVSTRRRSQRHAAERMQLYRLIEFFGRWSMLDIYVVALLVALVQIPALANVRAGPGALAFAAVVVLTMLATRSFDPRALWQPGDER